MFAYVYVGALFLGMILMLWLAATSFLPSTGLRLFYALLGVLSGVYGGYLVKTAFIDGGPLQVGFLVLPFLLPSYAGYELFKGYRAAKSEQRG
ncbi:hypothetical protein F4553_007089 [Allocatelliglobosispora scoriae]|uniref:Uncharacterized protein n=1 Tax=Allocatelliglobosispora scoriae TaxID=643052 RepID=A0A841C151_9ACTN|nr:hypothetical protein [Allocatelliglobosispora scoriae]MBB5873655.1 hypothetical protein [Allocatelliglobosispora scoriae]